MPPKSKRQRSSESNLDKARESKKDCLPRLDEGQSSGAAHEERPEPEGLTDLLELSDDALDTEEKLNG